MPVPVRPFEEVLFPMKRTFLYVTVLFILVGCISCSENPPRLTQEFLFPGYIDSDGTVVPSEICVSFPAGTQDVRIVNSDGTIFASGEYVENSKLTE